MRARPPASGTPVPLIALGLAPLAPLAHATPWRLRRAAPKKEAAAPAADGTNYGALAALILAAGCDESTAPPCAFPRVLTLTDAESILRTDLRGA